MATLFTVTTKTLISIVYKTILRRLIFLHFSKRFDGEKILIIYLPFWNLNNVREDVNFII